MNSWHVYACTVWQNNNCSTVNNTHARTYVRKLRTYVRHSCIFPIYSHVMSTMQVWSAFTEQSEVHVPSASEYKLLLSFETRLIGLAC